MAQVLPDNFDFSGYMESTDAAHKVRSSSVFVEDVVRYYHSPGGPIGHTMPWEKTHNLIRFRPGEVTLWSGYNGSGKSLVLGQVCLGLIGQGQRVCIASMEMKPTVTLARMARQASATNKPEVEFIRSFHRVTDRLLWLYDQQGTVKADKMLAVLRYCADRLSISHFVVDSLMKCGMGEDDYNGQKSFVDGLCVAARDNDIHVHLVAHSRKGHDELAPPGKMDVKGTGAITDQVDNVITVWRNKAKERWLQKKGIKREEEADTKLICDKQRNGEWEGQIGLWFDPRATQYLEYGTSRAVPLLSGLIDGKSENEGKGGDRG